MISIEELLEGQKPLCPWKKEWYDKVKYGWDLVAKPLDSMGKFEAYLSRIGAIQEVNPPSVKKSRILVLCADNGIVEEGISQSGQEVTAICAENIAKYVSSVGIMAKETGTDILVIDMGMNTEEEIPLVENQKVRKGTRNFHKEYAMTREEALRAIQIGMDLVKRSKDEGYTILGTGEMGIGNTTTSSAVAAALLRRPAEEVTGKGAGLSDEQLVHKKEIVQQAVDTYGLYEKDAFEVLCAVGGYDIAGMAGICIGGAVYHVPIVLDGFISMVAALIACRLFPEVAAFLVPSHSSKEPAVKQICESLGLEPILDANMALGEGTGAVLMLSLLKTANAVYENSCSFVGAGIEQYERL